MIGDLVVIVAMCLVTMLGVQFVRDMDSLVLRGAITLSFGLVLASGAIMLVAER